MIDKVISAEIPSSSSDPELHAIIKAHMVHGPCGALNRSSPCMKEGKCSKKFPKEFVKFTEQDQDGYPRYQRRLPADVKRVSGTLCQTFREACQRRGLIDDDNHLKMALEEAASCHSPSALRSLFAMILTACEPANPLSLWLLHRDSMSGDILNSHRQELSDNGIQVTDHMYNQCLCQIQDKVSSWVANNLMCMDCQCQT